MDPAVPAETEEEVFAVRLGAGHDLSVDEGCAAGELALRTAHPDRFALEAGAVVQGEAVDRMPLGHGGPPVGAPARPGGRGGRATG